MKKLQFAVVVVLLSSLLGSAQQAVDTEKPTTEQVRQFLDIMQIKPLMFQIVEGMKAAQKKGAEETFKHLVPNARPDQLERVYSLTDETFRDFPIDEMIDAIIPIYQRHFTRADLDVIIGFYKSPTGQKFLRERPAMTAEGMQAGQDVMLKRLPALIDRLNTRIAKLADDELKVSKDVKQ